MSKVMLQKMAMGFIQDGIKDNKIHIKTIGKALLDCGLNNRENILKVEVKLLKKKVQIVRG